MVKVVYMKLDIHLIKVVIEKGKPTIMKELFIIKVRIQEGLSAIIITSLDIQIALRENYRIRLKNLSQHILQSLTLQLIHFKRPLLFLQMNLSSSLNTKNYWSLHLLFLLLLLNQVNETHVLFPHHPNRSLILMPYIIWQVILISNLLSITCISF